jgi:predicted ferric reductase
MTAVSLSALAGLFAVWLLTLNLVLGLLLSVQYNPLKRWPHQRINYFAVHNWTAYLALALVGVHIVLLPFSSTAGWGWGEAFWPAHAPQQAMDNVLGALSAYLLVIVVSTSYLRRRMGRTSWKIVHYASFACAALFFWHGAVLDPTLTNAPINYLDPEKLGILFCAAVAVVATGMRMRVFLRRRGAGRASAKDLSHWDTPSPTEWAEG